MRAFSSCHKLSAAVNLSCSLERKIGHLRIQREDHETHYSRVFFYVDPRCDLEDPWREGCKIPAWSPVLGEKQLMTAIQCLVSHPFPAFFGSALYHKGLTLLASIWFGQWKNWQTIARQRSQVARVLFPCTLTWKRFMVLAMVLLVVLAYHSVLPSVVSFSIGIPGFWVLIIPKSFFFNPCNSRVMLVFCCC